MPAGKEAQSDGKLKPSKLSHIDQSIPYAQVPKTKDNNSVGMRTKI